MITVTIMKKQKALKKRVVMFKNMGGNILIGNSPGEFDGWEFSGREFVGWEFS